MTTNAEAIAALVASKTTLQAQTDGASGDTLRHLIGTIHMISSEIGANEVAVLNNAPYVPATDAFKGVTNDAKSFLATLNDLKAAFAAVGGVASALDSVIKLIMKVGL